MASVLRGSRKKSVQQRHQGRKLLLKASRVGEVGLATDCKKLRWRCGTVGIKPWPISPEAFGNLHLLLKLYIRGSPGVVPTFACCLWLVQAHETSGQGWIAVCLAIAHVNFVDEFVYHHILVGLLLALCHSLPAQHHRTALHGFTQQFFRVVMHNASAIHGGTLCQCMAWMDDDADKVVVPRESFLRATPV